MLILASLLITYLISFEVLQSLVDQLTIRTMWDADGAHHDERVEPDGRDWPLVVNISDESRSGPPTRTLLCEIPLSYQLPQWLVASVSACIAVGGGSANWPGIGTTRKWCGEIALQRSTPIPGSREALL